jgi:DNA (cytosine-5)-methyltransferase 1
VKVLNLYAGIGGNRKFWDHDVTAVEIDPKIAAVYSGLYPDDEMVIDDAHQYLLDHYTEFDFIWSSPPCQSHSRMIRSGRNRKPRYPDLALYEEILFLQHNFDGSWVVENVVPYYKPLIPYEPPEFKNFINRQNLQDKEQLMDWLGIHYEGNVYYGNNHCPTQVLRNSVHPDIGRIVFDSAQTRQKHQQI